MITILGKTTSINVRKVLWTCEEAGIAYQQEDYGSGFASTETDAFRALNPNAMVPVLIDGDFVLWESNSICRYRCAKPDAMTCCHRSRRPALTSSAGWTGRQPNSTTRGAMSFRRWAAKTRTITIPRGLPPG